MALAANEKKTIGVIGAGSWGTALAITLSNKGHEVRITDLNQQMLEDMAKDRENKKYLPGAKFGDNLTPVKDAETALDGADVALFGVPAQAFRKAFQGALPYVTDDMLVVNVAKGIERGTLCRMSEIAEELKPGLRYVALSGPSHAEEVGIGLPTTVVSSLARKLAARMRL